jgi:hypothetical protein
VNGAGSAGAHISPRRNQWKWQLVFALAVVATVYLSVARWAPLRVQNVLFVVSILLPLVLNAAGWVLSKRTAHGASLAHWRTVVVRVGLVANGLAIVLPWVTFLWAVYSFLRHVQPSASHVPDWGVVLLSILGLSILSLVAGAVATGWTRVVMMLNSLVVCSFVLSIPIGVL